MNNRTLVLLLCYVVVGFTLANHTLCQDKQEVYEKDFLTVKKAGNDSRTVASYWTQLAKKELNFLEGGGRSEVLVERPELVTELRQVLTPIFELENMIADLPPGDARTELVTQLMETYQNDELAESVFNLLGAEYSEQLATERLNTNLRINAEKQISKQTSISTYVNNPAWADVLSLSEEQKSKIKNELKKANKEVSGEVKSFLAELKRTSDERWEALLGVLDDEQANQA